MSFRSNARPHYGGVRTLSGRPMTSIKPTIDSNLPPFARVNTGIRSSSDYLKQVVGIGMGGTRAKSASSTSLPPATQNGRMTTAYGDFGGSSHNHNRRMAEDFQEELMNVKRNFSLLAQENASLKTKLKRIDDVSLKKDKYLDELLNQQHQASPFPLNGFSLSQRGGESRLLANSLKQKIMRLEQSVKDKDVQITKLKSDMKMTKIQEMRTQLDTFYQEIVRLKYQSGAVGDQLTANVPKQLSAKMKSLNETILRQNEANAKLISDNRMLKEQLESLTGNAGETDSDYNEWQKSKLIALIQKLERELDSLKENDDLNKTSARSDREKLNAVVKLDKMDALVKRLKEDRQHFKNKVDIKDKEIEALKKKLRDTEQELKEVNGAMKAAKSRLNSESYRAESSLNSARSEQRMASARKTESRSSNRTKSHRSPSPSTHDNGSPPRSSRPSSSRHGSSRPSKPAGPSTKSERVETFRRNYAAKTIQRHWKNYRDDEALDVIVGAARGHLARQKFLSDHNGSRQQSSGEELSRSDSPSSIIDGAVKGHLTRIKQSDD